jgi:hypothetical protein
MMHDAIELFLQLSSEYLNAASNNPNFMDYWEILNNKLNPNELEQRESMRRLNKARVALKHHGTFPSKLDIDSFTSSVNSFFEGNTPLVFGIKYEDISLIEFVTPDSAKQRLKDANIELKSGKFLEALDNAAIAFKELIQDYTERKTDRFYYSPFNFGRSLTFYSGHSLGLSRNSFSTPERKLGEFVDIVKESIEGMQAAIGILALGLDYRKYSKFNQLTPTIHGHKNTKYFIARNYDETDKPSLEDTQFCIDFVIECALALAEFDYTITKEVI